MRRVGGLKKAPFKAVLDCSIDRESKNLMNYGAQAPSPANFLVYTKS